MLQSLTGACAPQSSFVAETKLTKYNADHWHTKLSDRPVFAVSSTQLLSPHYLGSSLEPRSEKMWDQAQFTAPMQLLALCGTQLGRDGGLFAP
jgi:hypothetical protein